MATWTRGAAAAYFIWCCSTVSAKSPKVKLRPYRNDTNGFDCHGTAVMHVHLVEEGDKVCDLTYDLQGADVRCNNLTVATAKHACKLSFHGGQDCDHINDEPLSPIFSSGLLQDHWKGVRYDATPDGVAEGVSRHNWRGLSQFEMYQHVFTVTDYEGHIISCGVVTSNCMMVFGCCFYVWGRMITGAAAILAVLDSAWLIRKHMKYNRNPALRKYTARILLMVPIYSVQSFVALWFQVSVVHAELFRFFRELYEAIVLFSFLQFILTCVGGSQAVVRRFDGQDASLQACRAESNGPREPEDDHVDDVPCAHSESGDSHVLSTSSTVEERRKQLNHICPWSWFCPRWGSAQQMLRWCVAGTLLYIVVGAVVPMFVLTVDLFTDKHSAIHNCMKVGKYMLMVASMVAINSLFELAHIFLKELKDLSPLAKFASVKMVIFFTFWQGIVLSWLVQYGWFENFLDASHKWTSQEQISQAVQHGCICIEMFAASICHHFAFPPGDYKVVRRMHIERSVTLPEEDSGGNNVVKRFHVVDVRDILMTARFGIVAPRFQQANVEAELSSSEATSSEASESDDLEDANHDDEPSDRTASPLNSAQPANGMALEVAEKR